MDVPTDSIIARLVALSDADRLAREQAASLDALIYETVTLARERGVTYERIGAILNISKQAVWERYHGE